jgi:hypothetical protein
MTEEDETPGDVSESRQAKGGKARAHSLTPEERRRIASQGGRAKAEKATSKQPPRATNQLAVNKLPQNMGGTARGQGELFVTREREIDGVGMGVLSDGRSVRWHGVSDGTRPCATVRSLQHPHQRAGPELGEPID